MATNSASFDPTNQSVHEYTDMRRREYSEMLNRPNDEIAQLNIQHLTNREFFEMDNIPSQHQYARVRYSTIREKEDKSKVNLGVIKQFFNVVRVVVIIVAIVLLCVIFGMYIFDRVHGMPFRTLRENLRLVPELKETFKIGTQGGIYNWNSKLADENKRYTFFAPSDQAWANFAKENPSEFEQLDDASNPQISRSILDRHLSANGQFNKEDLLATIMKVNTIQGELTISRDIIDKEIYVEWEGKKAKIIKSDIYGLNGVIHVIDKVLAKKRDFKVNSVLSTIANCPLTLVIIVVGLLASLRR